MIDIGGFALAGPWAGSIGLIAPAMAWFVLPSSAAEKVLDDGSTADPNATRSTDIEPIDPAV